MSDPSSAPEGALMTPEALLAKLEENTREVMELKLKTRQLEEEKIEKEMEIGMVIEKHSSELKDLQTHYEEEIQNIRDELSSALEQIIQSDQQFDSLDVRKREEMEGIFQQLEESHRNLQELEQSSMDEITRLNRLMEDTKDANERLTIELEDLKNEHEIVDKFRNEELNSFRKDMDELTDVVVALEQRRANEEAAAIARFDELERAKNEEIAALRKQISASGAVPQATAIVVERPTVSEPAAIHIPVPRAAEPAYVPTRKAEPRVEPRVETRTEPVAPVQVQVSKPAVVSDPEPVKPQPVAEPTPVSTPAATPAKSWTPPASSTKPAAKPWTPPARTTTEAPTRPAWLSTKTAAASKPAATATTPSAASTPAPAAVAPAPTAAAPASTPAATPAASGPVSDLPQYTAAQLRGFLATPSTAFPGFDKSKVEMYLNDSEFQPLFGCTKAVYSGYPKWKQDPIKKKAKLF